MTDSDPGQVRIRVPAKVVMWMLALVVGAAGGGIGSWQMFARSGEPTVVTQEPILPRLAQLETVVEGHGESITVLKTMTTEILTGQQEDRAEALADRAADKVATGGSHVRCGSV